MKKSVAGVLALAAMGMFCGVSYAADQEQTSGKQEPVAKSDEEITPYKKQVPPKANVKYKRVGKNWINPQPEPPGDMINPAKHPNPGEKLWLNPQPEPPKPPDPTIKK
jgi:hypothetical protein